MTRKLCAAGVRTVKNYYRNFTRRKSAVEIFVKHRSLYNKKDIFLKWFGTWGQSEYNPLRS